MCRRGEIYNVDFGNNENSYKHGQGARKQRNVVHEGCGKAMRSMESVQNKLLL